MGLLARLRRRYLWLDHAVRAQQRYDTQNRQLSYDTLSQRMQNSAWDSRFNNLQSAWGALTGLLR